MEDSLRFCEHSGCVLPERGEESHPSAHLAQSRLWYFLSPASALHGTRKNHSSVPSYFAKYLKYLWLRGNANSEICHFHNTSGFQMLGIRMQLLQEPKVLVFLRTAARHLQCTCVLKPQQSAGAGATWGIKGCHSCLRRARGSDGAKVVPSSYYRCCGFLLLTSHNAFDKHQCHLLCVEGQHMA